MLTPLLRAPTILVVVLLVLPAVPSLADIDALSVAQQRFQSGLAYERLGRLEDAYTDLQLATNLDPKSASMALALGLVASRLERYDIALRALEHSIALEANSCASYYVLALLYEKKGMRERALESWGRFLPLTSDRSLKAEAQKHIAYLEGALE